MISTARDGLLLIRAALRLRQRYADALREVALVPNQHAVLSVLDAHGPMHQRELADRAWVDRGDVVAYLDDLAARGLVVRQRDPADRRRRLVHLTDAGRSRLGRAAAALDAVDTEVLGGLDEAARRELAPLTRQLIELTSA